MTSLSTQSNLSTYPSLGTANIAFGGNDRNLLFITPSKSVYGLKMRVKGAP